MHFDESKMKNGLGAGVVLTSPRGDQLHYILQIHFAASNNVAKYEALVHGIKLDRRLAFRTLSALATPIWWCSNAQATGMKKMPTWQAIGSWCSRSVDILK